MGEWLEGKVRVYGSVFLTIFLVQRMQELYFGIALNL